MLHVVVKLEVGARLEAHECHAHLVEFLDLPHLVVRDLDLLVTDRVKSADFLPIERLIGLVAHEALSASELLIIDSVDLLDAGLLGRDDGAEEGEADLGARRHVEHALANGALLELFLTNALHQLEYA